MRPRNLALCLCVLFCAACPAPGVQAVRSKTDSDDFGGKKTPATVEGYQRDQAPASMARPDSWVIKGYDQAREAMTEVDGMIQKKQLEVAGDQLKLVVRVAGETLDRIRVEKASGVWQNGLRYPTQTEGILGEQALIAKLTQLRDDATRQWSERIFPQIITTLKKKYGAQRPEQVTLLEQEGRPREQTLGKRGERCWVFEIGTELVTYCWDRRGVMIRRTVRDRPTAESRAP